MIRLRVLKHFRTVFIAIFSFVFGSMLTINLTPLDKTCKIDNTDREYNIMQNSKLKNPELIILIISASNNFDRRISVRNTWVNLGENMGIGYRFKHYFVVGTLGLTEEERSQLSSEQITFNDMLLLPMYDSYANLTEKVLKSFEWLTEQYNFGLNYKYAMKCDDDSFVNLGDLLKEIRKLEITLRTSSFQYPLNLPPEKLNHFITTNIQSNTETINVESMSLYWGYFDGRAHVKASGKWKENNWIFCDKYVSYALGGGYILSRSLVAFIGNNAYQLRHFNSEDISLGLWLSPVNNIIRVHDIRFDTEWTSRGCKNYHLVRHHLSLKEIQMMYINLIKNKQLCTKETHKRGYWLYDWKAPASQCCKIENEQSIT